MPSTSKRMSPEKLINRVLVWRQRKANPTLSIPALAELCRMPVPTVRHAVKLLEVSPKEILEAYETEAVGAWIDAVPIASSKGDHRPAKDLLLHSRAIEPVQLQGQTNIAIIFTTGTVPGLQSPSASDANQLHAGVIDITQSDVRAVCSVPETPEPEDGQGPGGGSG
jgi:hypothetical protein